MATFTSLGIGSGMDLNTMLTQLVAIERRPIQQLQSAADRLKTKVSAMGQVKSLVSAVQDAANALSGANLWRASVAKSGNEGIVGALGGSTAAAGSYAVSVQSLAAAQTLSSSATFADAQALVGEGTLDIDFGTWNTVIAMVVATICLAMMSTWRRDWWG